MRLKLRNFRYLESCEYSFEDSGLVLLTGPSGSGKSTLLKAIIYALYGKVRKPYTFGTKSCSVTLEFMGMTITRTSNPNRVIVNAKQEGLVSLEDLAAQNFINERLGMDYSEFMLSSYVPQKNNTSILSLSQADQIATIQTLAFRDNKTEQLAKRTKSSIKELTDAIAVMNAKIAMAENEIASITISPTPVAFPLSLDTIDDTDEGGSGIVGDTTTGTTNVNGGEPSTMAVMTHQQRIDRAIHSHRVRMKTFGRRIANLHEEQATNKASIVDVLSTQQSLATMESEKAAIQASVTVLSGDVSKVEQQLDSIPIDIDRKISSVQAQLKCLESQLLVDKLESSYREAFDAEIESRTQRITQLESKLWLIDPELINAKISESTPVIDSNGRINPDELDAIIEESNRAIEDFRLYVERRDVFNDAVNLAGGFDDTTTELDHGEDVVIVDGSRIKLLQERLLAKVRETNESIESLQSKKTEWSVMMERLRLEKELIHCPSCNAGLKLQPDNTLALVTTSTIPLSGSHDHSTDVDSIVDTVDCEHYSKLISDATKKIRLLESERKGLQSIYNKIECLEIPSLERVDEDYYRSLETMVESLCTFRAEQRKTLDTITRLKRELTSESFGAGVRNMYANLERERDKFEKLMGSVGTTNCGIKTSVELNDDLAELQRTKLERAGLVSTLTTKKREHRDATLRLESISRRISEANHRLSGVNLGAMEIARERIETQIRLAMEKQENDAAISEQLERYLHYTTESRKLETWVSQLEAHRNTIRALESKLVGFMGLKDAIAKAEVLAVDNVISTINEHTGYYLDTFFSEHHLSATIGTSTSGSKFVNKIEYRGNEYTGGVSELSGGEFDRVTLASICGINAMLNSPILMLDESLSSLDADTNTEIINFLKDLAENKLILVCSHEAVRGIFDRVVEFG